MAYADNLDEEGINSQYLVILKPRRVVVSASWTLVSGTEYTNSSFTFGEIVNLTKDGDILTEASSASDVGTGGDWFYDVDTEILYFDDGTNPSSFTIVATYEIYMGTIDAAWYRDPLDSTTRTVYFEPLITQSPAINQSSTDDLFGFLPTVSSSISVSNTTQFLQVHVYESSFQSADISVYHYLGDLTVANTKLILTGFCSNISYKESNTKIEIFDNRALFDEEFRHPSGLNFYASGTLSGLDPDFEGRPIRKVFGYIDKLIPVNIDFEADNPSTTNNRTWIVMNPHDNLVSLSPSVPSSPSSTTTRTYISSADGYRVGDTARIDSATDKYIEITAVNKTGDNYIEHAATAAAASSGDTVDRGFIGNVIIYREGFVPLKLKYIQDYTIYTDATNKLAGFTLVDNFESNYSASGELFNNSGSNAQTLLPSDLVFCRVYGPTNQETLSASAFGSDSSETANLAQAIVIIYSILKNNLGLSESELDTSTFTSLQSSITDEIGFSIPTKSGSNFPKYRQILGDIIQTLLLKFLVDDNGKYSLSQTGPLGSVGKTIEDDEILKNSFEYNFDYKDIVSNVIVEYQGSEVSNKNQSGDLYYKTVTSTSDLANYLHKVTKQKTFKSLHFTESEAQTLADRLKYALGDRRGKFKFKTKNRFFDSEINDIIRVTRTRLPGFVYSSNTDRSRDGAVVSSNKKLVDIDIECDDQKGIEDNSGSW